MTLDVEYWRGNHPKTTEELRDEIQSALTAALQWLEAAEVNDDDRLMIYAQIHWLQQLLKLAQIELK